MRREVRARVSKPPWCVLDACVLYPVTLRDLLLRAAEAELFRPAWSADILAEVRRNLIAEAGAPAPTVDRLIAAMQRAFPQAEVSGYQPLVDQMRNHPKDRHVLAAAFVGGARVIVTHNVRHFPDVVTAPLGVVARTPDVFLVQLLQDSPATMLQVVRHQLAAFHRPAHNLDDLLSVLARHAPVFAGRLRDQMT